MDTRFKKIIEALGLKVDETDEDAINEVTEQILSAIADGELIWFEEIKGHL